MSKTTENNISNVENEAKTIALKTPQELIHIKHKITLQQYKYWVILLQELKTNFDNKALPDSNGFYSMRMDELAELIGYTPKKSEIWNDLLALKNETIIFNTLNKDNQKEKYGAGFISEWTVSNSFVRYKFPSVLENAMRGLDLEKSIYSILNWNIFNHFTGKYAAILYKLSKDYIGVSRTPYMTVGQFREYIGVADSEYPTFKSFNQWCIRKPIDEINKSEISDILISCELRKEGRNIVGLYFKVEHKKQTSIPFPIEEENNIFRFAKAPISESLQIKYLEQRTQDEIELCIERANEYGEDQEKAGKAVNYGGLYRKAIADGWHEQQAQNRAKKATAKERLEVKMAEAEEADKSKMTDEKRKVQQIENRAKAFAQFETLPKDEQKAIEALFLTSAKPTEANSFIKNGNSIAIFKIFLVKHFSI